MKTGHSRPFHAVFGPESIQAGGATRGLLAAQEARRRPGSRGGDGVTARHHHLRYLLPLLAGKAPPSSSFLYSLDLDPVLLLWCSWVRYLPAAPATEALVRSIPTVGGASRWKRS